MFNWVLCLGFHSEGVGEDVFSSGGSTGQESASKLTQIVGRIHFPAVVGLKALAPAGCRR